MLVTKNTKFIKLLIYLLVVFNFASGSHTVANVTRSAFDGCITGNPLSIETNGPARYTIDTVGSHYFICTILNHCSLNQKLTINASSSNDTGNVPSPESPSGASSPFSPPSGTSSACALAMATKTSSLLFIFGFLN